jgi:beta-glucosidase
MLFHWEYPLALYHRGGWMNRDSADWFAEYASIVVKRLGDRVKTFMTIEEPQVFVGMGLYTNEHAPGEKRPFPDYLQAAHHALLAHGKGVQAIRANAKGKVRVGFAPASSSWSPATDSQADVEAARRRTFDMLPETHMHNAWWMDPPLLGHYPPEQVERMRAIMPVIRPGDMETIRQPIDFLGINVYNCRPVRAIDKAPHWEQVPVPHWTPQSGMGLMSPQGLYWAPRFFWERYKTPLMITENGTAVPDWVHLDGKVHDPQRIDYVNRYLLALARALREGVDVIGYHLWSFLDNFELAEGYKARFGLVYVDYQTQKRILKDSAHWYAEVVASNGQSLFKHGAGAPAQG